MNIWNQYRPVLRFCYQVGDFRILIIYLQPVKLNKGDFFVINFIVNHSCNGTFPTTDRSDNQNICISRGYNLNLLTQRLHALAGSDQMQIDPVISNRFFLVRFHTTGLDRISQRDLKPASRYGLFQIVVCSQPNRLDGYLGRTMCRHHNHRRVETTLLSPLFQQRYAVFPRQPDIKQDCVKSV